MTSFFFLFMSLYMIVASKKDLLEKYKEDFMEARWHGKKRPNKPSCLLDVICQRTNNKNVMTAAVNLEFYEKNAILRPCYVKWSGNSNDIRVNCAVGEEFYSVRIGEELREYFAKEVNVGDKYDLHLLKPDLELPKLINEVINERAKLRPDHLKEYNNEPNIIL